MTALRGTAARAIARRLTGAGHQAWLVGGCVRDLLLGREPKDFDLATSAQPGEILALYPNADRVGAHFGVVLVREGGETVEVATFRSDGAYRDGRRPEHVVFETDPRRDVLRRDFTINALLMHPETGEVLDVVGGRDDLAAGVIRAVGDPQVRFEEDHLRMLRAVRFAARLGFRMEPRTLQAIQSLAGHSTLVAAERVRDELVRILTEGGASPGFALLDESGLLAPILPEVAAMKGVQQPPEFHPEGDVWTHTLLMLEMLRTPTPTLAWGVLLHDVAKPRTYTFTDRIRFNGHDELGALMAVDIMTRLRFPSADIEQVRALVACHLRFIAVRQMRESTLKRFLRMDRFEEHLELHRLDCMSSHRRLEAYDFVRERLEALPPDALRPSRLLTGDDLIAAGYAPGRLFTRILEAVETAQLEGRLATREAALEMVERDFGATRGSVE